MALRTSLEGDEALVSRRHFHRDLAGSHFGDLRNHYFQDAMAALGADALGVGAFRQGEAAQEAAGAALGAGPAVLLGPGLALALAREAQHPVFHADLDVLRVDPGDIRMDHEALGLLLDIHGRGPV